MGTHAVSITNGRKSFHGRRRPVLDGVDLTVARGEMLSVDHLDSGTLTWDSGTERRRIGVVG